MYRPLDTESGELEDEKGYYYQTTLEGVKGNMDNSIIVIFKVHPAVIPKIINLRGYKESSAFLRLSKAPNMYDVFIDNIKNDTVDELIKEITPIIHEQHEYPISNTSYR
jgi:hypothetical protein